MPDPSKSQFGDIVAIGGKLSKERLIEAYSKGIFPWPESNEEEIPWWCPDPRAVIVINTFKTSRSLSKRIRNGPFKVTADTAFDVVIRECGVTRPGRQQTWITEDMMTAYGKLHREGIAHSVETWNKSNLVGGLYGVSLGRLFFGESMFSVESDASKVALVSLIYHLRSWNFFMIDCQLMTSHLCSLGAVNIRRTKFLQILRTSNQYPSKIGRWQIQSAL